MYLSQDLAQEPALVLPMLHGPSTTPICLAVLEHSTHVFSCLHALAQIVFQLGRAPPSTVLKGPAPRPLLPQSSQTPSSDCAPVRGCVILEGLGWLKAPGSLTAGQCLHSRPWETDLPPAPPSPLMAWNLSKALATSMFLWRY